MRIWLGGIRPAVTWPENKNLSHYSMGGSCPFIIPYPVGASVKYYTYPVGRNVVFAHSISCRGMPSDVADCLVRPCPLQHCHRVFLA